MPVATSKKKTQARRDFERRQRERALQRRDRDLVAQFQRRSAATHLDSGNFKIEIIRPEYKVPKRRVDITSMVESVDWTDESAVLTGTVTVRRPADDASTKLYMSNGHRLILWCQYGGTRRWRQLWVMRIWKMNENIDSDQITFECADELKRLEECKGDFEFKKERKSRPKGWKAHDIVKAICKEYKVTPGYIARGTQWITDLSDDDISPLKMIEKAYEKDKEKSKRQYVIRYWNQKLQVLPLQRQPLLYTLVNQITGMEITREMEPGKFSTVLKVSGSASKGKGRGRAKRKFKITVYDKKMVDQFGWFVKKESYDDIDTIEDARRKAKRDLKIIWRKATRWKVPALSHRLIPFVRRGEGVRVIVKRAQLTDTRRPQYEDEFQGRQSILFVKSATYSISSGDCTMELNLDLKDEIADMNAERRKERDKEERANKREKRGN